MNTVLAALNAKYIHTSLSIRCLAAAVRPAFPAISLAEFNINQPRGLMTELLVARAPDVVGLSCYIWNISEALALLADLKRIRPDLTTIVGGPEVAARSSQILRHYPDIDFLIAGEGELGLAALLAYLDSDQPSAELSRVPGLVYRSRQTIHSNPTAETPLSEINLDALYDPEREELAQKIIYLETSRGCPYRCQYCLSAASRGVRWYPLAACQQTISRLVQAGAKEIRFVDRTFNCEPQRALPLLEHMAAQPPGTRFQFEIRGDLLSRPILDRLERVPDDRFQLEIGVQSTNPDTLQAIERKNNLDQLAANTRWLMKQTQTRTLLDLIAGLPHESFDSFLASFDYVYQLQPTRIQLGFLKLLHGSGLRQNAAAFGCRFSPNAPYEVLATSAISYNELRLLHTMEDVVNRYYNSRRFTTVLRYLIEGRGARASQVFLRLAEYWRQAGWHIRSLSQRELYTQLFLCFGQDDPPVKDLLRFDYRRHEPKSGNLPWMKPSLDKRLTRRRINQRQADPRVVNCSRIIAEEFDYQVFPWSPGEPLQPDCQILLFCFSEEGIPAEIIPVDPC